jgi:rhodanese-related sulfurtransferase
MSSSLLSPSALNDQLDSSAAPLLIHVLSDEAYDEKRIPGSVHACVYEIAFLDKVAELQSDKASPIVVYGLNDSFGAAALALERLNAAGYFDVHAIEGGLDAWLGAGFSTEGEGETASLIKDGSYPLDMEKSVFRWTGRNLFNQHNGRIAFKSGNLETKEGHLAAGSVVLDMTQITCSDIKDEGMGKYLINHLGSDDFFSVPNYSEAGFQLTEVRPLEVMGPGDSNLLVSGVMTLRGKEQPIEFKAQETFLGGQLGLQGQFEVDRTQFGSVYGSGKIFEKLGQHVVNDIITVSFQLICPVV